jgi:hypothetical protein
VTHWQRALVKAQFGMGREATALPQSVAFWATTQVFVSGLQSSFPMAHTSDPVAPQGQVDVSASQNGPEAVSQNVLPHRQSSSFLSVVSVFLQALALIVTFPSADKTSKNSSLLHWLSPAMQYIPVVSGLSHVDAPQVHATSLFTEVPSVIAQAWSLLHLLCSAVQNIPVVFEFWHSNRPQVQMMRFSDEPSSTGHSLDCEHVLVAARHTVPVPFRSTSFLVHTALPHIQGV